MLRLRLAAWRDASAPHPSVGTLQTYATGGIAVHAHALAFHGVPPGVMRSGETLPRALASLAARGRAWQGVYRGLRDWRSAEPVDPIAAQDLTVVGGLLRTFAPLSGEQPALAAGDRRHLGQAIAAAVAMTTDIGRWNQTTIARMGPARQIYVRAETLTGAQVSDSYALAAAKLTDRCVVATPDAVDAVASLYDRTTRPKNSALVGAEGLTLRAEPLRAASTFTAPAHDPIERT